MASILKVTEITTPDGTGNITVSRPLTGGTGVKGGDIASASPLVIDTDGDYFDVTGTTNFAAMTVAADRQFTLQFDGALTMTHHATNLDLPSEANITTAAGDVATFQSTGSNTVQCISYVKADGTAVVGSVEGTAVLSTGEAGGTKYLREDGDGTSSWQTAGGNKSITLQLLHDQTSTSQGHGTPHAVLVQFEDGVTDTSGTVAWTIPDDFTSFVSLDFMWTTDTTSAVGVWTIRSQALADGEDTTGGDSDVIANVSYTSGGTAWDRNEEDILLAVDGLTLTPGHQLAFAVTRKGGSASDALGSIARSQGIKLVYT